MFCRHCGTELPDNSSFCGHCGTKVDVECEVVESPVQMETQPENQAVGKDKKKKTVVIAAICAAVLLIIAALYIILRNTVPVTVVSDAKASELIENAKDAIIGRDYDEARSILKKVRLGEDSVYNTQLDELNRIIDLSPVVKKVDTSDFPNVTITLSCEAKADGFSPSAFCIEEDTAMIPVSLTEIDGKTLTITYMADGVYEEKMQKSKLKFSCFATVDFSIPFEYQTVPVKDANVSFVTSNVTNYPEIAVYFKVEDSYGQPIDNLDRRSFRIRERLDINDYMEREILSVSKLDGVAALNVSLVIDKSDSIDNRSMSKIKSTTNEFLSKLQFSSGDKAGIISFDSYVMEMCAFTNNRDYLTNGVNSMYPYGMTACYDAIIKGINNAANQSGARCVICFTDGMDNESVNSYQDVIAIANQKSVPVYIIGVGSGVEESVLRNIANSTGGTYHHIDDVSDMSGVYEEIFREQKSMYCITYRSSESSNENETRTIYIEAGGKGFRGTCNREFTPVIPVSQTKHTSRYEVIPADVSWEEANTLCNQKGGHLATITSQQEADTVLQLAEQSGKTYIWLGGYTTNSENMTSVGHWITGEPWTFDMWMEGEPSRFDKGEHGDGAPEFYLMLWKVNGAWSWNDQRNDLQNSEFAKTFTNKMAYVIEYEE